MKKTRFTNMTKKMILPLVASGMMCVTGAYAQSGDIIGFYSPSASSTFVTPGTIVQFTIRLYGTIGISNLVAAPSVMPQIRVQVGSEDPDFSAYATLFRLDYPFGSDPSNPLTRTDLAFSYTIRPGDMADPLTIFENAQGFQVVSDQFLIYKLSPGNISSIVIWKVNNSLYDYPGFFGIDSSQGVIPGDFDLSGQDISIQTLCFDDSNSPTTLIARQAATTWRITSGATNTVPVEVMVWTPHTNVLQIGSIPGQALAVTIPAGADYADFAVKGLDTNAIPTLATVYAQRPSDYAQNGTAVMNYISRAVTIEPPGPPTISIEFPNGRDTQTLPETTELATGSFRIVLSEADTSRVYVSFAVAHQPRTLTNIVITPQPGGYYVNAGQEMSDWYTFSVKDGTRDSSRSPYVRINASATNTAKYAFSSAGILNITNVAPCVLWYPPSIGDENMPVTFEWDELIDADADMAKGITFKWNFGDGASVTQTNYTTLGSITHTYYDVGDTPKTYTVTLTILDADRGSYTLPTHTITISPPPPPPNVSVVVNRADLSYQEGEANATYRVVLSEPALQNTFVALKGQYLVDDTSSDDCLTLTVTNNIFIATGLTSSVPYTMTIKDGTSKTATGINIVPTITNASAQAQFPIAYFGIVYIQNVAPVFLMPIDGSTNTLAGVGEPCTFNWSVKDVAADLPDMMLSWDWGDGTTTTTIGGSGTTNHTYQVASPLVAVTVTATDKDGDFAITSFYVTVANLPKYLTVNEGIGSGWYLEGATAIVSADADPMYKEFAEWTGTASDYASNRYMRATTVTAPAFPSTLTAMYRDSVARTSGCWGRGFTMDGAAGGVSTDENAGAPSGTAAVKLGGVGVVQDNGFVAFKTVVKGIGTILSQAGVVPDNGFVAFETVVSGSGTISFLWKVSSQMNADYLKFKIDGIETNAISGTEGSWAQVTCRVEGIGDHTLRWEYVKDGSVSVGMDAGWVDDIVWVGDTQTPALAPVIVLATLTNQTMAIQFTGERGITYFVQTNGMLNPVGWGDYQSIEPIWVNESNGVHRFEVAPPASGPDILFYRIATP